MSDTPKTPARELRRRAERAAMRITLAVIAVLLLPPVVVDLLA